MKKRRILGLWTSALALIAGCSGDGGGEEGSQSTNGPSGTGAVGAGAGAGGTISTGGSGADGGTGGSGTLPPDQPLPPGPTAAVRIDEVHQQVEGFGFSTAWGSVPPADQMDAFFSLSSGAGFSIIRNRIPLRENPEYNDAFIAKDGTGNYQTTTANSGPDQYKDFSLNWSNWDLKSTRDLIAEVKGNPDRQLSAVFSTPWTPPNNSVSKWKLGVADYASSPEVGGYLDPDHYADYADLLADYVLGFEDNMGAPLAALSIQNEPSYEVSYESCDWTAQQMKDFVAILDQEFRKKGVYSAEPGLAIMAPEHNNFQDELIHPILDDSATAPLIGIVGAHMYEFGWASNPMEINFSAMTKSVSAGKRIWMTEWNASKFGEGNTMAAVLAVAKSMDYLFSEAHLNAYVYWWAADLLTDGIANKVLWTIAQYSRFVRPGWHRIDADTSPATAVRLVAFMSPENDSVAIVVTNLGNAEQTFNIQLSDARFDDVTPYRTSSSESMAELSSIPGGNSWISATVPAESISTYVASLNR